MYIYCLYIPVLRLKPETFTDSLNQRKAQVFFFKSVQYFKLVDGISRNRQLTFACPEFYKQSTFSQKLIFFANKIFGYFEFVFYITLTVTFLQVNFIFIIVLYIFPVCLLSFLVVYELKSFIYIHLFHFFLLSQFQLKKKNGF